MWDGVGERGGEVVGFLVYYYPTHFLLVYYYPAHFRRQAGVPLVLLLFDRLWKASARLVGWGG